jgi:hypothetical protein
LRQTTSKLSRTTSRNSPLLLMATGSPFTVILNSSAPYWQQTPSLYVSVISHSATLGAEAARGLARDQSTSTIPESPARFRGRVIILAFDHNAVLDTAPPSVLELPVDWTRLACLDFDHNAVSETALIKNGTTGVASATIFTATRHTGTKA